jgi:hypothetical protein
MAPTDKIRLPLRWQFVPVQDPRDGAIHWRWRAYTQTGALAMQCERESETLTDCMADARDHGYDVR